MEDWNEEFLAVEVEREIEKHNAERPETISPGNGAKSKIGCLWLVGLVWLIAFLLFTIAKFFGFFLDR